MAIGRRGGLLSASAAVLLAAGNRPVAAQQNVIRLVVPWAPGGQTDVLARIFADVWARQLSQSIIVDNRSGASGTIGHAFVAGAPADGRTILIATNTTYAVIPHLVRSVPYRHDEAFAPVALLATAPMLLWASRRVPARTLQELIAYSRTRPDELNMGNGGIGTTSHLATELLMAQTGLRFTQVNYRGAGDTVRGLATGEIDLAFLGASTVKGLVEAGGLRALAATGQARSRALPDVPTIAEAGLPDFETSTYFALFVPKATPAAAIERLSATAISSLDDPTLSARLRDEDIIPLGKGPGALAAHVQEETAKWGALIRDRGISVN